MGPNIKVYNIAGKMTRFLQLFSSHCLTTTDIIHLGWGCGSVTFMSPWCHGLKTWLNALTDLGSAAVLGPHPVPTEVIKHSAKPILLGLGCWGSGEPWKTSIKHHFLALYFHLT